MVLKKHLFIFIFCALLFSCGKKECNETVFSYLTIKNESLKNEIKNFIAHINSINKNKYVVTVRQKQFNDTLSAYKISYIEHASYFRDMPFHFVSKVENRNIYFTIAGLNQIVFSEHGGDSYDFFSIPDETYLNFMKIEFPEQYEQYVNLPNNDFFFPDIIDGYPEMWTLTFVKDHLIKKEIDNSLEWW